MYVKHDREPVLIADNDSEPGERRRRARAASIFAYGKLYVDGVEHLCQIRNISAWGVGIEARHAPRSGTKVMIEMRGLEPCHATIVWQSENRAGLEFDSPQDLQAIFDQRAGSAARSLRSPRFTLSARVTLESPDGMSPMDAIDISLGGIKLSGAIDLEVGDRGSIALGEPFEPLHGELRWKQGEQSGFQFDAPLRRDALLDILAYGMRVSDPAARL